MFDETLKSGFEIEVELGLSRPTEPGAARSLAVLLHGMGQDGAVIREKLGEAIGRTRHLLAPNGPLPFEKQVGEGRGIGHAWYLYTGDQEAFLASAARTGAWLNREIDALIAREGLEPGRVHLVGYSQGGYLAGIMALQDPGRFASLTSLCSRLKDEVRAAETDTSALPPILALHGRHDRFIAVERAEASAEALRARGATVDFQAFDSGHGLSPEQAATVAEFLDRVDANFS